MDDAHHNRRGTAAQLSFLKKPASLDSDSYS
jgi:hypothetical protein